MFCETIFETKNPSINRHGNQYTTISVSQPQASVSLKIGFRFRCSYHITGQDTKMFSLLLMLVECLLYEVKSDVARIRSDREKTMSAPQVKSLATWTVVKIILLQHVALLSFFCDDEFYFQYHISPS